MGSGAWAMAKQKAKKKIKEVAYDLIQLYAKRKMQHGFSFQPDSYLQNELESSFIFNGIRWSSTKIDWNFLSLFIWVRVDADYSWNSNIPVNRICLAMNVFQDGWITSKETQKQIDTLHLTLLKYPNQITVWVWAIYSSYLCFQCL